MKLFPWAEGRPPANGTSLSDEQRHSSVKWKNKLVQNTNEEMTKCISSRGAVSMAGSSDGASPGH